MKQTLLVDSDDFMRQKMIDIIRMNPTEYTNLIKWDKEMMMWINFKTMKLQSNFYTLKTKIFWILNDLTDFPKCKRCGKRLIFQNVISLKIGYRKFCSTECLAPHVKEYFSQKKKK